MRPLSRRLPPHQELQDLDPLIAAGVLLARARSQAQADQRARLLETLESIDVLLSQLRDNQTLPFVWRTVVPLARQSPTAAPEEPQNRDRAPTPPQPCPLDRESTEHTCPCCLAQSATTEAPRRASLARPAPGRKGRDVRGGKGTRP